ncbi:T9SS type A sorting domain-containing protein [Hymenobacter metallilatus]|nr:T9SS type A sorting domain-containing protein [Hymenobacter metallilatus]
MRTAFLLILLSLLTACEEPAARFDEVVVARPLNLAQVLGPRGMLLAEDTIQFGLTYDAQTGLNTFSIEHDSSREEWLSAQAFRYRGLYYLVTARPNSGGSWVHAVRIRRGLVQGLNTGHAQMQDLSGAIEGGRFAQLVRFRSFSGDSVRVRFDKRQLHSFYAAMPDSFPAYRLRPAVDARAVPLAGAQPTAAPELYPNPATTETTLRFSGPAHRQIQVLDLQGRLVGAFSTAAASFTFSTTNLPSATYLVRVESVGGRPASCRLVVAR